MEQKRNTKISMTGSMGFSKEASIGLPIITTGGYSSKGMRYIPYSGNGGGRLLNNLYPQYIAQLSYDSPTNGAAIARKSMMIMGEGFNLEVLPAPLYNLLEDINKYGDTANDLLELISRDMATFNGFALKVRWSNSGLIYSTEYVPFTHVRCGEANEEGEIDYYVVSNNWDKTLNDKQTKQYAINKFNPEIFGRNSVQTDEMGIPTPNEQQIDNAEQLIYFYIDKPSATNGMQYYPVPDYIGGFDAIETEIQIGISNKCMIDNGFGGKYIVTFPYEPNSEQEMQQNNEKLISHFTGADNNGGIITLYAADPTALPKIDKIEPLDSATYLELNTNVKQSIITAHQIPAILLEVQAGTSGFNNRAEEMRMAYDIYQKTNIKMYQQKIVRVFKTLCKYMGYPNAPLEIIPFTLTDKQTDTQGSTNVSTN